MKYFKSGRIFQILVYMLIDGVAISLTYVISIFLFNALDITMNYQLLVRALPFVVFFKLLIFYLTGFYKMLVNHVGFEDIIKLAAVSILSNAIIMLFITFSDIKFMIRSGFIFITPLEIGFLAIPRTANRIITYIKMNMDWNNALGKRTLIVGAGSAGELVVKEIYKNKELNNIPIAFIDDDHRKIGSRLSGIKIVGPIQDIEHYLHEFRIEEVIIAIANYPSKDLQQLIEKIAENNIKIKKLMSMTDVTKNDRPQIIDVKIEDLLNRDEIRLEDESIKGFIKDQVVLVTGGGGSIGSELCRQIALLEPKEIIIFDIYENTTYDIQQELLRKFSKSKKALKLSVLIGSVYNRSRLEYVFKTYKPDIVFHAAAYKHVPLMEDSAVEAVRTNVIGTYNASSLSALYQVKKFVLVSSDKAVRSTNIMGATKRYAELIIQEQQSRSETTKFSAVRFGNVLGSNGSVIPLFKKQIEEGGPVTVTHKEITRYFMTIPEAVGLIMQCAVYAKGGEVFILDMGEPVRIMDLAEKMIKLAGLRPYYDIKIEVTGLRPGEKLYEELLVNHNLGEQQRTENEKIFIEKQKDVSEKDLELAQVISTLETYSNDEVKNFVGEIITTYKRNGN